MMTTTTRQLPQTTMMIKMSVDTASVLCEGAADGVLEVADVVDIVEETWNELRSTIRRAPSKANAKMELCSNAVRAVCSDDEATAITTTIDPGDTDATAKASGVHPSLATVYDWSWMVKGRRLAGDDMTVL